MTALARKDYDDEDEYPVPQPDDEPRADTPGPLDKEMSTTLGAEAVYSPVSSPLPTSGIYSKPYPHKPPISAPWPPSGGPPYYSMIQSSNSPTWTTSVTLTPQPEGLSPVRSSPSVSATDGFGRPTDFPGTLHEHKQGLTTGGMYAVAAITPIVVLAAIAAIVFLCMRKRRRRRNEAVATQNAEQMKKHSRSPMTTQAYMAPLGASPPYTVSNNHLLPPPNPALLQPVILGPIPSGANGAYFTGIDTSDAVSMNSASNLRPPPNPFSDNESLTEPPPPYRPRSVAPPSFSNSSRQSSFRATMPPPESSRTHLIEHSPFEDPFDDDAVSDLSGPTAGQSEDAMSAVSDLVYQNEPVVNEPAFWRTS
jgi:hypothetical protein